MSDFLLFVDKIRQTRPIHVEIYYSKIMDWVIKIWKAGCAQDYPNSKREGDDAILVYEQGSDMELVFAKAHVALKEWMIENQSGY